MFIRFCMLINVTIASIVKNHLGKYIIMTLYKNIVLIFIACKSIIAAATQYTPYQLAKAGGVDLPPYIVDKLRIKENELIIELFSDLYETPFYQLNTFQDKMFLLVSQAARSKILRFGHAEPNATHAKTIAEIVKRLPLLEEISFKRYNVRALTLAFKELSQLSELKLVNLSQVSMTPTEALILAPSLSRLVKLEKLALSINDKLKDAGVTILSGAITSLCNLQHLDLSYVQMTDIGAIALSKALEPLQHLKYLYMNDNKIGSKGAFSLISACKESLEHLSLIKNLIGIDVPAFTAFSLRLAQLTGLKRFYIADNPIGHVGLQQLSQALTQLIKLEEIDISGIRINWKTACMLSQYFLHYKHLNNIHSLPGILKAAMRFIKISILPDNITTLDCDGIVIPPSEISAFVTSLMRFKQVTDLRIGGMKLDIASFHHFLPFISQLSLLKELAICNTTMGDKGAIELAKIIGNFPALEILSVSFNEIGHQGMAHLIGKLFVGCKNFKMLYMSGNKIGSSAGDENFALFVTELSKLSSRLTHLELCRCALKKQDVLLLAPYLKEFSKLESLGISVYDMFDDDVIKILASSLAPLPKLTSYDVPHRAKRAIERIRTQESQV